MSLRVLHCPSLVGGNPQGLARAERELGLASRTVVLRYNRRGYPVDETIFFGNRLRDTLARRKFVRRMEREFDVVHYNFGSSVHAWRVDPTRSGRNLLAPLLWAYNLFIGSRLELSDLVRMKRAGKVICVTYQGNDARQGDVSRERYDLHAVHELEPDYYTQWSDRAKRERIRVFDRHADYIYALNPDLLGFLPERARFMAYAHVDPRERRPSPLRELPAEPLLVHAPTHRGGKGTKYVLAAFEKLKADGVPFRYELIENKSQEEVRRIFERADLLIDQLLFGWYGGVAVEFMTLGKPAVCYLRDEDLTRLPVGMVEDLPLIRAEPDTIYTVLSDWLTNRRGDWAEQGKLSRRFVKKWHDPLKIAGELKKDYERAFAEKKKKVGLTGGPDTI